MLCNFTVYHIIVYDMFVWNRLSGCCLLLGIIILLCHYRVNTLNLVCNPILRWYFRINWHILISSRYFHITQHLSHCCRLDLFGV